MVAVQIPERYPFDGSDASDEFEWRRMARLWATSGVVRDELAELAAAPVATQRKIQIAPGQAWVDGHFGQSVNTIVLDVPANATADARKDIVVVRVRRGSGSRGMELDYRTGSSASYPAPTETEPVWETVLYQVLVPAGFSQLSSADILDVRPYTSPEVDGGSGGGGGGGLSSVTAYGSQYTEDQLLNRDPSFEGVNIASFWQAITNCGLQYETSVAHSGSRSARMRAAAAGDMIAGVRVGTAGVPVTAGSTYRGTLWVRAQSSTRQVRARFNWYDAAGVFLSISNGPLSVDSAVAWSQYLVEAIAPASAAFVSLTAMVTAAAVNEDHYVDDFTLRQKLVPRSSIDFEAYIVDDPANDRVLVSGDVGSDLALFHYCR